MQGTDSIAASELMRVLPRLHNVRELSVGRPSNKGHLQFNSICNTLVAIGSQLTRLRFEEMRMRNAESIVAVVSPRCHHLRDLVLHIARSYLSDGSEPRNLGCIVHRLIAPARDTLEQLELHFAFLTPTLQKVRVRIKSDDTWIGELFEALAQLRLPKLRSLSVRTPFCGEHTRSEEVPLAHFIQAHAIERLDVGVALVDYRDRLPKFEERYYRFLSLITLFPNSHLRELTLHVKERDKRLTSQELSLHANFTASICSVLTTLTVLGHPLEFEELTQIIGVTNGWARTLHSLHIFMESITPAMLMELAPMLPSLHNLTIRTTALCGETPRFSETRLYTVRSPRRANDPSQRPVASDMDKQHILWMRSSALHFIQEIQTQRHHPWTLRRLSIQLIGPPAASSGLGSLEHAQPFLAAFEAVIPTLVEATIDIAGDPQYKTGRTMIVCGGW
jgi:hypothetical protein